MVYYRKYRPQTIDELDSTKVRDQLSKVLLSADIPHAFLCTGPKGLGKTSTARIIAKVVNCENSSQFTTHGSQVTVPCNVCESCISITNGTNLDILEIDGASNRGIDEIRDLREKVKLAPVASKKKVYIIDEVHMLTTEAFNALLKTIEEPPAHVMFLFCTTEPHKVPATIMSRCFHIAFERATDQEIVHSLERITKGENLHIEKAVLTTIATLADGGFRDAAKILEELVLEYGKDIKKEMIDKKLRITNYELRIQTLLLHLSKKQTKEALSVVAELYSEGVDMKYFLTQVLEFLHTCMLQKAGIQKDTIVTKEYDLNIHEITELVGLFSKAYQDTKYAVISQLPLEMAIISWCMGCEPEKISAVPTSLSSSSKPTLDTMKKEVQTIKVNNILHPTKEEPKKTSEISHEQRQIPPKHDLNTSIMENLIYKTKSYNHSVAAVLRSCRIIHLDEKEMVIETPYKFHKERLDEKQTREILEKAVKEITGKDHKIRVELHNK